MKLEIAKLEKRLSLSPRLASAPTAQTPQDGVISSYLQEAQQHKAAREEVERKCMGKKKIWQRKFARN
jgi:hypothetical protein